MKQKSQNDAYDYKSSYHCLDWFDYERKYKGTLRLDRGCFSFEMWAPADEDRSGEYTMEKHPDIVQEVLDDIMHEAPEHTREFVKRKGPVRSVVYVTDDPPSCTHRELLPLLRVHAYRDDHKDRISQPSVDGRLLCTG